MTKTHDYQYDITTLLGKDETGLLSSFTLELDSILSENDLTTSTEHKLLGATMNFLHGLSDNGYDLEDTNY